MKLDKLTRRKKIPEKGVIRFYDYLKKNKISGRLLDVGCGYGRHTFYFSKKGFDSYGIDQDKERIKFAKNYSKQNKLSCKFKKSDITKTAFKTDFFDIIIDIGCFHHIPKYKCKKYINNILKLLKIDGLFYLIVFSDKTTKFKKQGNRKWQLEKGNYYRRLFSKDEVVEIFSNYFDIIKIYEPSKSKNKDVIGISVIMKKKNEQTRDK